MTDLHSVSDAHERPAARLQCPCCARSFATPLFYALHLETFHAAPDTASQQFAAHIQREQRRRETAGVG